MKRRDAIAIATTTIATLIICVVVGRFKKPQNLPKINAISEFSVESASEESDYQTGFKEGYNAFKDQMGLSSIPSLPKNIKYLRNEEEEVDQEQRIKGYVDGYHRAADSMHCPGYSH